MPPKKKTAKPNSLQNASSQDHVKLFKLPAELRNRVYDLVLDGRKDNYTRKKRFDAAGLLLTCKMIYAEARQIYFNKTKFCFENITEVRSWLRAIGLVSRRHVRYVTWMLKFGSSPIDSRYISGGASMLQIADMELCKLDHELQANDVILDCGNVELVWLMWSESSNCDECTFGWKIEGDGSNEVVRR